MLSFAQRATLTTLAPSAGRVGFIGLGQMGARMAANLDKAGYQLAVCDPSVRDARQGSGGLSATLPA